jgi:hypothetical protein
VLCCTFNWNPSLFATKQETKCSYWSCCIVKILESFPLKLERNPNIAKVISKEHLYFHRSTIQKKWTKDTLISRTIELSSF